MSLKQPSGYLTYLAARRGLTNTLSIILGSLILTVLIITLGIGSGIFSFVLVLMAAGTLVVSLVPLNVFRATQVGLLYLLSVSIELFLF